MLFLYMETATLFMNKYMIWNSFSLFCSLLTTLKLSEQAEGNEKKSWWELPHPERVFYWNIFSLSKGHTDNHNFQFLEPFTFWSDSIINRIKWFLLYWSIFMMIAPQDFSSHNTRSWLGFRRLLNRVVRIRHQLASRSPQFIKAM